MAENAAIPPSPKRQADPAAGEEGRDAKKLKQGKTDVDPAAGVKKRDAKKFKLRQTDVKKMMDDFMAEYDKNADEQAILDLVAKFKNEYNGMDNFELRQICDHLSSHPPSVIKNAGDSALFSWFVDCWELNFPERDHSKDLVRPGQTSEGVPDQPDYKLDDPLPKGHAWASFFPGGTSKDYALKRHCAYCGELRAHWTKDCPRKSEFKDKAKQARLAELAEYFTSISD